MEGIGCLGIHRWVEEAMRQGLWSRDLFEAALEATNKKNPGDWRENCREAFTYEGTGNPIALVFEHADGFASAHILLAGHLHDFTCALRLQDSSIVAGRCADAGESSFYGHFATLNSHIERFFLTGKPSIPPASGGRGRWRRKCCKKRVSSNR